jgi:hypothetical protein
MVNDIWLQNLTWEEIQHSWAYIEDVGRAAAILGTHKESLGQVWIAPHAPAVTQGEMVKTACRFSALNRN